MVNSNLAFAKIEEGKSEIFISESPLKWCSVSLSDVISRGKRLEASVFDVEAKQAWDQVHRSKYMTVPLYGANGLIENAYYPGWMQRSRLKRIYCEKQYGEGFYLPSQMMDIYPVAEKHISRLADCDMDELRLKSNTLLLTRSGTIGSVSYVSRTLNGRVFSDDVIRISFKNEYDLGYVYTFLKSETGNLMLRTNGYGSVITHIEPGHLEELQIPNAPVELRKRIHELIKQSYSLRDDSNDLMDSAKQCLIEELHLPPIWDFDVGGFEKNATVKAFNVRLSNLTGRIDASHYVPIINLIKSCLKKYSAEVATIGDPRISKDILLPGRFKRVYVEKGYGVPFFGGRSTGELDPSDKKYLSFSQHNKKIKEELTIREKMVLVTCSGTVGKVTLVPKHWDGWAMTHDIIRIVPADSMAGFIYVWLGTDYAEKMIDAQSYGSVVRHIEKEHIASIPVPLLKDHDLERRINNLALLANDKRYEAYKLEQQALEIMDKEIIFAK